MMLKNRGVWMISLLALGTMVVKVNAQDRMGSVIAPPITFETYTQNNAQQAQDTIPVLELTEGDLSKIGSIRTQFEKQNNSYSRPLPMSSNVLRFLQKDKLEMSVEAKYWLEQVRQAARTYDDNALVSDTPIVNSLFLPLVFRGEMLPTDFLADFNKKAKTQSSFDSTIQPDSLFKNELRRAQLKENAYVFVRRNNPQYFRYTEQQMPTETIKPFAIKKETYDDLPLIVEQEVYSVDGIDGPPRFIPERLYWQSGFESVIQFSQNYISPNWHKGGTGTLNLFTRNYLRYDYKREKVKIANEMELKISTYTAPKDTLRDYKMGDDLFRIRSTFGYQAFDKWSYSFDTEFRTQFFNNYQENTNTLQTAFLSPFSINMGIGMKFDLDKRFADKNKYIRLNTNIAPLSYTYMYSLNENIDLSRHGFEKKPDSNEYERVFSKFGSTIRADLEIKFNRNVNWQSRLFYNTSYDRVVAEFENTLTMAISRFFSTRIYLHLRYDDGVTKSPDFDSYYQINELLSFGFNYKW